jgi:hypothetical protein
MRSIPLYIFLLLAAPAGAAKPETLRVELTQRSFEITLTDKHLFLRSERLGNGYIARSACNEPLVKDYWNKGTLALKKYPVTKSTKTTPAALFRGKRHALISLRSPASLANLDREFQSLQLAENKKCKKR